MDIQKIINKILGRKIKKKNKLNYLYQQSKTIADSETLKKLFLNEYEVHDEFRNLEAQGYYGPVLISKWKDYINKNLYKFQEKYELKNYQITKLRKLVKESIGLR